METKPQNKFDDMPREQRAEMLEGIAINSFVEKVRRDYTEDEKLQMKDAIVDQSMSIKDTKFEMKEIVKEFNTELKKFEETKNDALDSLKKGYAENEEKVYCLESETANMVDIHDANGEYLYSRTMRPEERQTRIVDMPKTGTHG